MNKIILTRFFKYTLVVFAFIYSANLIAGSSDNIDLSSFELLGFHAGGTETIQDVKDRLGVTRIWHTGDASESESKVCYRIPADKGETIVVFASNEEMANPVGQINSIRMIAPNIIFSDRNNCSLMHKHTNQLRLKNNFYLGMSLVEANTILGAKRLPKNGPFHQNMCKKRYLLETDPMFKTWSGQAQCFENPTRPYVNDCGNLQLKFKNGRVVFISINMNQSIC